MLSRCIQSGSAAHMVLSFCLMRATHQIISELAWDCVRALRFKDESAANQGRSCPRTHGATLSSFSLSLISTAIQVLANNHLARKLRREARLRWRGVRNGLDLRCV